MVRLPLYSYYIIITPYRRFLCVRAACARLMSRTINRGINNDDKIHTHACTRSVHCFRATQRTAPLFSARCLRWHRGEGDQVSMLECLSDSARRRRRRCCRGARTDVMHAICARRVHTCAHYYCALIETTPTTINFYIIHTHTHTCALRDSARLLRRKGELPRRPRFERKTTERTRVYM